MEYSMACDAILLRNHPTWQVSRPLQAGPSRPSPFVLGWFVNVPGGLWASFYLARPRRLQDDAANISRGWLSRQDRYDKSDVTVRKTLDRGWSATRIVARDQRLRFEDRPDREPPRLFHWFALPSVRRPATRDRDLLLELKPSPFFSPARDANQ